MHGTNFIGAHIKGVTHTCFGTSVPSSGSTECQFYNQMLMISGYLQDSSVCGISVVDVD
jgi:hypothetical protein